MVLRSLSTVLIFTGRAPGPEAGERVSWTHNELKRKKLAPTSRFLVLVCRVQLFAKHLSCPIRYRLCGFTQFAADEVRHYAEAAAMRGVVVHEQFIGTFGDFGEILG